MDNNQPVGTTPPNPNQNSANQMPGQEPAPVNNPAPQPIPGPPVQAGGQPLTFDAPSGAPSGLPIKLSSERKSIQPISMTGANLPAHINSASENLPLAQTETTINQTNPAVNTISPQQPSASVNGQPYQPNTPITGSQLEQSSENKPSKWRYFFLALGILQIIGVILFFLIMTWAIRQAKAGVSGTEFISLIVFTTLVPAVGLIALINLIGQPIYIIKKKPHGLSLALSIVSVILSLVLVLYGAYSVYQFRIALPKKINELSQQSAQRIQSQQSQFTADNANPEITKAEAIQLLKSCQLKGFYYTKQTDKSDPANGGWGELSKTGVVLTKIDGKPYRISIADKLIPELVPVARKAQKTCGGPQFWHDGNYEQYHDGHWYFNNKIVN